MRNTKEDLVLMNTSLNIVRRNSVLNEILQKKSLYLMALPGILFLFVLNYMPLTGIVLAFKKYNIQDGVFGSPWIGLENFKFFFTSTSKVGITSFNTLVLNTLFIVFGIIFQVSAAVCINEIKNRYFAKATQSILFFPYFMSWVVVGSIIYSILSSEQGTLNSMLATFGVEPISWYSSPQYWKAILVITNIWKWVGYGTIIYLSTISGFDESYYEAAIMDGASRFQQMRAITLPMLIPTVTILTLFSIGRIFYGDFGMIYGIVRDTGPLLQTTEVIDTYVYRAMRQTGDFSLSTAIGLYQSLIGFIIVIFCNKLSKKFNDGVSLF